MWVLNGLSSAFFASLERCSCIRISTYEQDDDEANDDGLPLIFNDGNLRGDDGTSCIRRRRLLLIGKGKKAATPFAHQD